ncbi:MAG: hypothetical protein Q9214_003731 [Letrouitia sp. 1 TL-2023]
MSRRTSQASTMVGSDIWQSQEEKPHRTLLLKRAKEAATSQDVFLFLVAFRILNALSIKTFFQPDEFFQSLEPAWQMAFGNHSGAWITWEWDNQLRSAIHPTIFALVYWLSSSLSNSLRLSPHIRAELLVAAPKATQAVFAAIGDYYTWKLGERVYGGRSNEAWATLALTICSPWQWFCSTRTLSNCLETSLTIIALYSWPWHWSIVKTDEETDEYGLRKDGEVDELAKLSRCLLLAALACVLRPTNIMIWACLASIILWQTVARARSLVLAVSSLADRLYYQQWTFPAFRFLYFNLARSLAIHYGKNDWHYYFSQGYPLLLTTFLPFGLAGIVHALSSSPSSALKTTIRRQLATVSIFVPCILSLVSHKEVRFIYPLLPGLHVLAASPMTGFFKPTIIRRILLATLLTASVLLAFFATNLHQTGPINVLTYLREESVSRQSDSTVTAAFLMPCHSTPWRSHLIFPGIKAWALTCDPPLHLPPSEHGSYLDEADRFYTDPKKFLSRTLGKPPRTKSEFVARMSAVEAIGTIAWDGNEGRKAWTEYLVFFEQLEPTMKGLLQGSGYSECWRGWNTFAHDDWRRKGDVMVWCLDGKRRKKRRRLYTEWGSIVRRIQTLRGNQ